jgi:hypothetical protein
MGHVAAPELSPHGGKTQSHCTRGSAGAHLGREVRSRATEHVAALAPTSVGGRGLGPWDTKQRQRPPWQGGEIRGHGTHASAGAHLSREVRSKASGYVAVQGCTPSSLS